MMSLRKLEIWIVNFAIVSWLTYTTLFSPDTSDFFGVLVIAVFAFLFLFNLYAIVLLRLFPKSGFNQIITELAFLLLLFMPMIITWVFTS